MDQAWEMKLLMHFLAGAHRASSVGANGDVYAEVSSAGALSTDPYLFF